MSLMDRWPLPGAPPEPVGFVGSRIEPQTERWVVPELVPCGRVTLVMGPRAAGKSYMLASLVGAVTRGRKPSAFPATNVLYIGEENDPCFDLRRRLDAAGADPDRWKYFPRLDYREQLEAQIEAFQAGLVVFDPIDELIRGANNPERVREVLQPLSRLARLRGISIIAVKHITKDGKGLGLERLGGSGAWGDARVILGVCKDPRDVARRLVLRVKCSAGKEGYGRAFWLREVKGTICRCKWEQCPLAPEEFAEAMTPPPKKDAPRPPSKVTQAREWLAEELKGGARRVRELKQRSRAAGFRCWSAVQEAKAQLKIRAVKIGGTGGYWVWRLPPPKFVYRPRTHEQWLKRCERVAEAGG